MCLESALDSSQLFAASLRVSREDVSFELNGFVFCFFLLIVLTVRRSTFDLLP